MIDEMQFLSRAQWLRHCRFKDIKDALKCLLLLAIVAAITGIAALFYRMPRIIGQQSDLTRAMIAAKADIATRDADQRLAQVTDAASARFNDALNLLDRRTGEALDEVHQTTQNADKRTGEALAILNRAAAGATTQMSVFNATMATTLKPIGDTAQQLTETARQVNVALPDFLDCQIPTDAEAADGWLPGNQGCLYFRFEQIGLGGKAVSDAMPKIAASAVGITASADATGKEVAIAAKRFNAPQTKWQQFRMWLLTVARIAGDF